MAWCTAASLYIFFSCCRTVFATSLPFASESVSLNRGNCFASSSITSVVSGQVLIIRGRVASRDLFNDHSVGFLMHDIPLHFELSLDLDVLSYLTFTWATRFALDSRTVHLRMLLFSATPFTPSHQPSPEATLIVFRSASSIVQSVVASTTAAEH